MPLTKKEYARYAAEFLHQWEQRLDTYHAYTLARQTKEWGRVASLFDKLIKDLSEKGNLSPNQIYKLAEYRAFLEQSKVIMDRYAKFNVNLTKIAQRDFANAGMTTSNTLLRLIDPSFSQLPVEAINKAIGKTAEGSPLYDVFKKRFDDRIETASNIFIEGTSRGLNPNEIARQMRTQLDISVYDSTRITRTESLNIYRDIAHRNYVESGLVDSYIWIAESDACDECLEMEKNSPYPISEAPTSLHPFDRCSTAPNIG